MIKLVCGRCGKNYSLNSMDDFSACSCGVTLSESNARKIQTAYFTAYESFLEIQKRSSEGSFDGFKVSLTL